MHEDQADKAARLSRAEDDVTAAVQAYRDVLNEVQPLEPIEIVYTTADGRSDNHRFSVENASEHFENDPVFTRAAEHAHPRLQLALLSMSPHWEDRIRADALERSLQHKITMPPSFPCIYEPSDSPNRANALRPSPSVWVASPDEAMLHELLPLYQELWSAYEAQWPNSPSRVFKVGRLNGVSRGVYRPGTTPEEVIGQTMLTHEDMYRHQSDRIKSMHPYRRDQVEPPEHHAV